MACIWWFQSEIVAFGDGLMAGYRGCPIMSGSNGERVGFCVTLLLLYAGIVFLALWIDSTTYHLRVLTEEAASYTPVIFAPLAGIYCLAAAFSCLLRRYLLLVGFLAILVGAAGTFFHTKELFEEGVSGSLLKALQNLGRPVFAPAGFAGNGLLLILAWWCGRRARKVEQPAVMPENQIHSKYEEEKH